MKRLIGILLSICMFLSFTACGTPAKESPVEDFTYEMEDGSVTITGYTGSDLEIYIPATINDRPVTAIGEEAFRKYDMTHITIPNSVTQIDGFAFNDCKCLTSVKMSQNIVTISEFAFYSCPALTEVVFPDSLLKIGTAAFEGCTSLQTVSLPENLMYLGKDAFARCDNLDSLIIPDNTELEISVTRQQAGYTGNMVIFLNPLSAVQT